MTSPDPLDRLAALAPEVDADAALASLPSRARRRGRLLLALAAAVAVLLAGGALVVSRTQDGPLTTVAPVPDPSAFGPRDAVVTCGDSSRAYVRRADALAVAADGTVAWRRPLPLGPDTEQAPQSASSSPVGIAGQSFADPDPVVGLAPDVVVFATETDVRAYDRRTGALRWRGDGRAAAVRVAGDVAVVAVAASGGGTDLVALAVADGRRRWAAHLDASLLALPVALADGGFAFVDGPAPTDPQGAPRRRLTVLDADGRMRWRFESPASRALAVPMPRGDLLLWRHGQAATAFEVRSGKPRWEALVDERSDLLDAGTAVVSMTDAPELTALVGLDPASGRVLWRRDLERGAKLFGDRHGNLYRTTYDPDGVVARIDERTGGDRWTSPVDGGLDIRAVADGSTLYAIEQGRGTPRPDGTYPGPTARIVGRSVETGAKRSEVPVEQVSALRPAPGAGVLARIVAGQAPGAETLAAYDGARRLWSVEVPAPVAVVAADRDGLVVTDAQPVQACASADATVRTVEGEVYGVDSVG